MTRWMSLFLAGLVCAAALFVHNHQPNVLAQEVETDDGVGTIESDAKRPNNFQPQDFDKETDGFSEPIFRSSNRNHRRGAEKANLDPRSTAANSVRQLRKALNSNDHNREQTEAKLKEALTEYFLADMQHRARELEEIKNKVRVMEEKLEKRRRSQNEIVGLQLKLFVHEADGLGFFAPGHNPQRSPLLDSTRRPRSLFDANQFVDEFELEFDEGFDVSDGERRKGDFGGR